jgi:peptidoglycan/xylan/chitin deacetylase (PgdA/CDA1 family)
MVRRQILSSFGSRMAPLVNAEPLVSFCFDDFPRTAYLSGGAILKRFGARGTYYAAPALMNSCNDLGEQFTQTDLESLITEGHELGCHTFSHISCRKASVGTFASDVRRGRESLLKMTGCDPVDFAYPFGHVTLVAKTTIGSEMKSCRGIYGGVNHDRVDLNLMRANSLYGNCDQLSDYESMLDQGAKQNSWLIFYTHDVRESPSPFGCTPVLLDKVVSLAIAKGFRVAPVRQVVNKIERNSDPVNTPRHMYEAAARVE